ncbi:uncharacterized protein C8Q71DRAFT_709054 [Rhodofomes roseus]|uniref:Reverse transcriptase zinc-binding domain-containing protein n=1 Tax=Rhodofomes roseus TaxID=34475 RepID=A0ABQ8KDK6_9APHY|nr:uncharacterized protein C8Q71DRAFT_709054 [Rhodofomes roseus]KAH9835736.1 hypothetical protein C8Q71DRAFT_709054 [Rhodofomes roseus]
MDVPLNLVSETKCLVNELVKDLARTEDKGWLDTPNQSILRAIVNTLRQRCAPTTFRQVNPREDRQPRNTALKEATKAQNEGRSPTQVDTSLEATFNMSGARLNALTQRVAYRSIRTRKNIEDRRATLRNITRATEHIAGHTKIRPKAEEIWKSLRHKDIRRTISDFLWKTAHNAHKCGEFWEAIPNYEDRGTCKHCDTTDSMEHILTDCVAPGQETVWRLASDLWRKKKLQWTKPRIDEILTVGMRRWKNPSGKKARRPCAERLWRILISESAFLIWKLRCERVIGHADEEGWCHTEAAIKARWVRVVNERLHLDMAMTHRRYGRKALNRNQVLGTWINTLHDELALPDDWTMQNWVLVGIEPAPD